MSDYKRLTKLNGEPETIFNFQVQCKIYKRLQELEDKIENGELIENNSVAFVVMTRTAGKTLVDKALKYDNLKAKIEQGLMLELPRKCYLVTYCCGWEIFEYNVLSIKYDYANKEIASITCVSGQKHSYTFFTAEDIGETWFLTKEQAKQKLKELKGDK